MDFLITIAFVIGVGYVIFQFVRRETSDHPLGEFFKRLVDAYSAATRPREKPAEEAPAEPEPPKPVEIVNPPQMIGNMRRTDDFSDVDEADLHVFPDCEQPATPFEDFNRRLFLFTEGESGGFEWPDTMNSDFPTRLSGVNLKAAVYEIRRRIVPRHPVVFDSYGYFANASAQLELNPDYSDEFIRAYTAISAEDRPVVVSATKANSNGRFAFLRHGFEPFPLSLPQMRLFVEPCLHLAMRKLIDPEEREWLWFSVARMRQEVIRAAQADEALKRANEAAVYLETQAEKARAEIQHQNRFLALWEHRIAPPTPVAESALEAVPAQTDSVT